jgi:hypothetical protein
MAHYCLTVGRTNAVKMGNTPKRFPLGMKFSLTMRRKYEKYGNHKSPGAIAGHL